MKNDWKFCGPNKLHCSCTWNIQHAFEDCKIPSHQFLMPLLCFWRWRLASVCLRMRSKGNWNTSFCIRTAFVRLYYIQVSALWSFHCMRSLAASSPYCTLIWTWHRHFIPAACFIKFTALPNHTLLMLMLKRATMQNELTISFSSSSSTSSSEFLNLKRVLAYQVFETLPSSKMTID